MDIDHAYRLITEKLTLWTREFIRLLPNIFLAALIMTFGFFIARSASKALQRLMRRFIPNQTLDNLFGSLIYLFLLGVFFFIALSILKLDKAVTTILAGAGIAGLALAFAFQDIAANFMSGILISIRRPLNVGDIVKVKDYMGKVEEINLRDTIVRTFQGQMVIIPNKDVFQNPIENYSMLGKRRFDLSIGVSYGDDLDKVKTVTLAAVKDIPGLCEDSEVTMFYQEFGDSSINFVIRLWVNSPEQPAFLQVGSEAIMRIKKAYDENDIMIPFPIRTLDFGIKGGVPLSDMKERK
ncbi:mechanosensitive ion channel [Mucilaginibacter sp. 21P]|uniref:mechanosensitive ion channel family protein n=1 Tax=Mucilaginibacter sp. 21P TaxID=2778902 RepID=UPI001C599602|nr:mechanosensitive ion channel family protein [Mucilaginibacter sp. 21P]QXV66752.1 mechanosensitive ion channel [Mucilaginibacter sp. 21P]